MCGVSRCPTHHGDGAGHGHLSARVADTVQRLPHGGAVHPKTDTVQGLPNGRAVHPKCRQPVHLCRLSYGIFDELNQYRYRNPPAIHHQRVWLFALQLLRKQKNRYVRRLLKMKEDVHLHQLLYSLINSNAYKNSKLLYFSAIPRVSFASNFF